MLIIKNQSQKSRVLLILANTSKKIKQKTLQSACELLYFIAFYVSFLIDAPFLQK